MLAAIFDPLRRLAANPQLAWIVLWIGLASLIVALLIMIRTSWGQSNPLRKCVALSLLAHLLLAAYATTVEIVLSAGVSHGESVRVVLVSGETDDPSEADETNPWDLAVPDESPEPTTDSLDRTQPDHAPQRQPAENELIKPDAPPLDVKLPHPPPLLESPKAEPTPQDAATIDETPPSERPHEPPADITPLPKPSELPPTEATPSSPPAERPSEPLAPLLAATSQPALPEPAVTSELDRWISSTPSAAQPSQPAPLGPITDVASAAPSSAGAVTRPISASDSNTNSGFVTPRATPEIYADRFSPNRAATAQSRGGSPEAEASVQAALKWLAANQSEDGRWEAAKFGAGRETKTLNHDRQGAGARADSGVTGLALLAFLGAGNTHLEGEYAKTVQRGLEYLLSIQAHDGNLAGRAETYAFMYSHGMAALALSEAYAMTRDSRLEPALRAAIHYTLSAQLPVTGGWRYRAKESSAELGDTSQLGWQLMALKSAELAGIEMPQRTRDGIVRFLRSVSSGRHGGIASYRPGEAPSRAMTAEALVCRQFMGMARENPASDEAGNYLLGDMPRPDRINLYYWYYGTLGMYQLQGSHWERWNNAMQATLVSRQVRSGSLAGSWDPDCLWGGYGGRVYSTAMSALCLEVYYRYLPIYRTATVDGPVQR